MRLTGFDHVNILTANLDGMIEWYDRVLGLKPGARPDFGIAGAWLYLGDLAIVHLVHAKQEPRAIEPKLEHFAIRADGLAEWRAHFQAHAVEVAEAKVPGTTILQLNIHDPDGNHIHVDFDTSG